MLPAYWVRGDDVTIAPSGFFTQDPDEYLDSLFVQGSGCPKGHESYNVEDTHPFEMWKYVDFGCFEMDNCIQYSIRAELGDSPHMPCCQGFSKLEAPTAYLNSNFDATGIFQMSIQELQKPSEHKQKDGK